MSIKLKHYLDFDLQISRTDQGYRARVLNAPVGAGSIEFSLPFSEIEIENYILRLGHNRQKTRRLESTHMESAKQFGGQLFQTVFTGEVLSSYLGSLAKVNQGNEGLRIRLRLADAPELIDLPWEFLYNPSNNRFLTLSINTPIVRYLELSERVEPLPVTSPLRILVMIASPSDYTPLDVEQEWNKLKESLADLEAQGLVILERIQPTLAALQQQLRKTEFHIFHFIGHGGFDTQAEDGVLILEDETGKGREIPGQYLGMLLHDERTLRLAVLNSCEGGRTSRHNFYVGVGQSLLQQGIPAVVAMQFEITDKAAVTLAREFYSALAVGYPIDAALSEARKGVFASNNDVEWGTPVLYTSVGDGQIFQIRQPHKPSPPQPVTSPVVASDPISKPEEPKPLQTEPPVLLGKRNLHTQRVTGLATEAQNALMAEDWATAIQRLEALLALEPDYTGAQGSLEDARAEQSLAALYRQAQTQVAQKQWVPAKESLSQLFASHPTYKDVRTLIAEVEKKLADERANEIVALWKTADGAIEREEWSFARERLRKILSLDPNHEQAKDKLPKVAQRQQLADTYRQAYEAYQQKEYEKSLELFVQIQGIDANYIVGAGEEDVSTAIERIQQLLPKAKRAKPNTLAKEEPTKSEQMRAQLEEIIIKPTAWQLWWNATWAWFWISIVSAISLFFIVTIPNTTVSSRLGTTLSFVWVAFIVILADIIFTYPERKWRIRTRFLITSIVGIPSEVFIFMMQYSAGWLGLAVTVWVLAAPVTAIIVGYQIRKHIQPQMGFLHILLLAIIWVVITSLFWIGTASFGDFRI